MVDMNYSYTATTTKKMTKTSEKQKLNDLFSHLYELDVAHTIKKDLEEEEINYRA